MFKKGQSIHVFAAVSLNVKCEQKNGGYALYCKKVCISLQNIEQLLAAETKAELCLENGWKIICYNFPIGHNVVSLYRKFNEIRSRTGSVSNSLEE